MTDFALSAPKLPVIVGWRIVTMDHEDDKYKNHPRKFQVKLAAEEFKRLLEKTNKYKRVEVREILKVDGV